jgi:hypothetical protein
MEAGSCSQFRPGLILFVVRGLLVELQPMGGLASGLQEDLCLLFPFRIGLPKLRVQQVFV